MDETKGRESGARGQKVEGTGRKSDDENQEGPSLYNDTYPPAILAWAVLFHDVGKPATFERLPDRIRFNGHMEVGAGIARQIGRRLRMSNDEIEAIAELVLDHLKFKDVFKMKTSTLKRFVRRERFLEHLELHRLDCLASHGNLDAYHFVRDFGSSLKPEDARPKLFRNGNDLMDLGYTPGPEFKKILTALEDAQLESLITDRETALEFLKHAFPLP
jgi:poly(A) polymerase